MNTRSLLISAGAGGIIMSFLSIMPVLSMANCILCLWMWVGGIMAVYIYTRMEPGPLPGSRGAAIGAVAGIVGAVIFAGVTLLIGGVATLATLLESVDAEDVLLVAGIQGAYVLIVLVAMLVLCPGIGALAGLIGAELFGKPQRPTGLG
jgi:hypothetical protein